MKKLKKYRIWFLISVLAVLLALPVAFLRHGLAIRCHDLPERVEPASALLRGVVGGERRLLSGFHRLAERACRAFRPRRGRWQKNGPFPGADRGIALTTAHNAALPRTCHHIVSIDARYFAGVPGVGSAVAIARITGAVTDRSEQCRPRSSTRSWRRKYTPSG